MYTLDRTSHRKFSSFVTKSLSTARRRLPVRERFLPRDFRPKRKPRRPRWIAPRRGDKRNNGVARLEQKSRNSRERSSARVSIGVGASTAGRGGERVARGGQRSPTGGARRRATPERISGATRPKSRPGVAFAPIVPAAVALAGAFRFCVRARVGPGAFPGRTLPGSTCPPEAPYGSCLRTAEIDFVRTTPGGETRVSPYLCFSRSENRSFFVAARAFSCVRFLFFAFESSRRYGANLSTNFSFFLFAASRCAVSSSPLRGCTVAAFARLANLIRS